MAAGKLCPQNRCPLFTHKGMQISPSAEWTLRTDPHGTHPHSETHIESCTAMQLTSIKRKTSRTNDKDNAHSCFVCVCVWGGGGGGARVYLSTCSHQVSFFTMKTKTLLKVWRTTHTHTHTSRNTTKALHFKSCEWSMEYLPVTSSQQS